MVSKEDIENLAALARIKLSDTEIISLQKDVSSILDYVGQVSAVAEESESKRTPLVHNVMRDDVLHTADSALAGKRDAILAELPRRDGDFAIVRKIIQKDE